MALQDLPVITDSRLRLPAGLPRSFVAALKRTCTHANPDFHKKKAMGFATYGVESSIATWELHDKGTSAESLSLPRGATSRLRDVAREHGYAIRFLDRRVRHEHVEWPALRFVPRWYQDEAIEACLKHEQGIVRAPTGCITGDAVVGVNRGGKSFKMRLADLVHRFNGGEVFRSRWDRSIVTKVRARGADGVVRLLALRDAWASGEKLTYLVETASGHRTRATLDHRFLTPDGWRRLGELAEGDSIIVEGARGRGGPRKPRADYRMVSGLRGHHADYRHVAAQTTSSEIVSISLHGLEQTYDLELEAPHNFLADGIVVHNSGKTLAALALARIASQPALVIMRDSNLLSQWLDVAVEKAGLHEREVGILKGGSRLRTGARLTLALQQTLYSGSFPLDEVAGRFGIVIVDEVHTVAAATFQRVIGAFPARFRIGFSADECVVCGTRILMGDGSYSPIESIRSGDEVMTPLGPRRVVAAMFKGICETGVVEWVGGSLRCTADTWFAGPDGWYGQQAVSSVRFRDERQRASVSGVREADEDSLPGGVPYSMRAGPVHAGGGVCDLRGRGDSAESTEPSRTDAFRRQEGVGEERRSSSGSLQGTTWGPSTACEGAYGGDADGGSGAREDDPTRAVCCRAGDEVRREAMGEGQSASPVRGAGGGDVEGSRVRDGRSGEVGHLSSEQLHVGRSEPRGDGRRGDRRVEPQSGLEARRGHEAGHASASLGVGGSPAWVDLRSLRASEHNHRDALASSFWDGLSVPVFDLEVEGAACYYANGVLVHNTRKDKKEFLVYDQFGRVVYEIERDVLEGEGAITPVEVVLVPTDFRADWYRDAQGGERDFNQLLDELTHDPDRNAVIVRLVEHLSRRESPSLVFSHRIEHARSLSDVELFAAGVRCGLLLGGDENRVRFAEDKARLKSGDLPVCTGTFQAVGQGIDMPAVRSGVMATPIGNNRQFFGQVRGRVCRPADGKEIGRLYVLWDRHVFPDMPRKVEAWNGGRTSVAELGDVLRAA